MKKLVSALIHSMPDFAHVGFFLVFIFSLFAIFGMQQYSGDLYNACRYQSYPESVDGWLIDDSWARVCTISGNGNFACPSDEYCGNPSEFLYLPLSSEQAILKPYMYYGIHNFNNFLNSLQIVFQLITTEAWSTYMYNLMDVDSPWFAIIYTITTVVVGSFFLMNLILAVIINAFITITRKELEEEVHKLNDEQEKNGKVDTDEIM